MALHLLLRFPSHSPTDQDSHERHCRERYPCDAAVVNDQDASDTANDGSSSSQTKRWCVGSVETIPLPPNFGSRKATTVVSGNASTNITHHVIVIASNTKYIALLCHQQAL
jgi:hypothetical protein